MNTTLIRGWNAPLRGFDETADTMSGAGGAVPPAKGKTKTKKERKDAMATAKKPVKKSKANAKAPTKGKPAAKKPAKKGKKSAR